MANHRKPESHLRLAGTYRADRHERSLENGDPIDTAPPPLMPSEHVPAWDDLCKAGIGYLQQRDRIAVEFGALLLTAQRNGTATPGTLSTYARLLGELGLTAVGRQRLNVMRPQEPIDPADDFSQFLT